MTFQDKRVDQQDAMPSSMEAALEAEVPPTQEEGKLADQDMGDQSGVGMLEAALEERAPQEQEMPQPGEIDTLPQEVTEPMEIPGDLSGDDLLSKMPMEPPAQEPVVAAFEQPGTVDE